MRPVQLAFLHILSKLRPIVLIGRSCHLYLILRLRFQVILKMRYRFYSQKVHIAIPKTKCDPMLLESFDKVNEKYFSGFIELSNLKWGRDSIRKLGSYEYGSDTITISKIFMNADKELLDCVMYHEMLHKKHKFHTKNGRSYHHTTEFSKQEKLFQNQKEIEKRINAFIRQHRRKRSFLDWF